MNSEKDQTLKPNFIKINPDNWQVFKIEDVCSEIFSGGTPSTKKPEYWGGGINWLSSGETRNKFIRNTEKTITKMGVENSSTRMAQIGDIVVASAGQGHTRGQAAFCLINTYINQSVVALRVRKEKILPMFLFYNIISRYEELRQWSDAHSSRGSLTTKLLSYLDIKIPTLVEQKKIIEILSGLDFKIELNHRMNKTLEAIGEAVFQHWFVDFEFPDENNEPYKSSGGKMVYNDELEKEIPKGWKEGGLGEICEIVMGQSPPGKTYNETGEGISFFQGNRDFGFRFPYKRVYCTRPTRFAQKDDVLLSIRAPVGSLNIAVERCAIGRGVASIRLKEKQNSYLYYLLLATRSAWNRYEAKGTVFGSATKNDIHKFKIIIPPKNLRDNFGELIKPLDQKIFLNEIEARNIMLIRDSLLPKLMNGKIMIK